MKLNSLDGLVVILVVWIAYLLGRKKSPADNYADFCLARRSLNDWNFLAAFFGANLVFTAIFIIISHEAARRGWWALSIPIAFVCGVLVLAGLYKRLEPDFANGITLHGAFERAFASPALRKWCALWTIVAFVGHVSIEFYGAILLLKWIGLPFLWTGTIGILLAAICTAFTMSGGLRGVTRADVCLDVASLVGVGLFFYALYSSPPSAPLVSCSRDAVT